MTPPAPGLLPITVSDVRQHVYCPRIPYFRLGLRLPYRFVTGSMQEGILEHQRTTELEHRRSLRAETGQIGGDGLVALALPIDVNVPVPGRYLGLAEPTIADAVSFRDGIVFAIMFEPPEERHHLVTTGLALAAESAFERPFDIGCTVFLRGRGNRVEVRRDFHVIGDEVRQVFIEEQDDRMHMLDAGVDPGLPEQCPPSCPLLVTCRPSLTELVPSALNVISATLDAVGSA